MLHPLLALLLLQGSTVSDLDALAQKRDVEGLKAYATPELLRKKPNPFLFVRRGGAYGSGLHGWKVVPLQDAGGGRSYAVFTTRLTSEDIGEQVFVVENGKLTDFVDETDAMGMKLLNHEFDIRFAIPDKRVEIVDKMTVAARAGAGPTFMFRIFPNYKIASIKGPDGSAVEFNQAGGTVSVRRPSAEQFQYTVAYSGVVNQPRWAGSITADELQLTNDHWYPMIARQAVPFTVTSRTPANWMTVAQGVKTANTVQGTERVMTYRMDLPSVYNSLSAGPYRTNSTPKEGIEWTVWSKVMTNEQMAIQNELNRDVITYFAKAFETPYPFPAWGSLVSDLYGGGALEAYSFATYGTGWLPAVDGHEPAHTWWGGIIPNTYLRSFWNESFASFSDQLYRREGPIGNVSEKRLAFIDHPNPDDSFNVGPMATAGADSGPAASSLGYGKGSYVLQMLELELGTETMRKTMAAWLKKHPKGEVGEWEDYEKVVDEVTGESYKWFFDQWIRGTGIAEPTIKIDGWANGRVNGTVTFKTAEYRMTPEVLLQYPGGKREIVRTKISGNGPFSIPATQTPALVSIDPYHKLLRTSSREEEPVSIQSFGGTAKVYVDPKNPTWLAAVVGRRSKLDKVPANLAGHLIIGHPANVPALRALCERVGFKVAGNTLTYDGTSVDLRKGGALAVVELAEGKRCLIGLGTTVLAPSTGHARVALFDSYGRFLRGKTDPKLKGWGVFQL